MVRRSFTRLCGRPSAHGPVAFTTARARTLNVLCVRRSSSLALPNLRPRRALEAAVIQHAGPALRRRAQRVDGQPRVVREAVVVAHRAVEARGGQARHALQHFGSG